MCKSEIFAEILKAVSRETEVSAAQILSGCKQTEIVDARSILIRILIDMGFYPDQIASYMNRSSASVRYLISHYSQREKTNKMIGIYMQNIRKHIENI